MIYTPEEKGRIDRLLEAFRSYIDGQDYYDVVFSPKAGFLRVIVEGEIFFPLADFDDLLRMFIDDFLQDEESRVNHFLLRDFDHVRTLLMPHLNMLGEDREYTLQFMERKFDQSREEERQFYQDRLLMIQQAEEMLNHLRESINLSLPMNARILFTASSG